MSEKDINKKEVVLAYALENNYSKWLIKEIKASSEDGLAISFCYKQIQNGDLYESLANDAFFYLD